MPVFSFGENDLFQQFSNPPDSWVRRMQEALQTIPSVALPLFHGCLGLLIPFRVPIHSVSESCISLPSAPSWEDCSLKAQHPSPLVHVPGTRPQAGLDLHQGRSPVNGMSQQSVFSPSCSFHGRHPNSSLAKPEAQPGTGGPVAPVICRASHTAV